VCKGTGSGDFAEETILLVSALRLWGESAWANGGESGSSGAGGVEKGEPWSLTGGGNRSLSPIKGRLPLRGKVCPVL
jgi:hypothetical protein